MTKEECKKYLKKGFFEHNPYMWFGVFLLNTLFASFYFDFEYHKIYGLIMAISLYVFVWDMKTKENFAEVERYLKKLEERDATMVKFSSEKKENQQ